MERWRAGFLILVASGITFVVAAAVPWAQLEAPREVFYAWELHMFFPLAFCLGLGATVLTFAFRRSVWAGMVGICAALGAGLTVLMIHGNLYAGLVIAAPLLRLGETPHVAGYGVGVLFAAGMLAGLGGLITAVQTAPKVVTTPPHDTV
jgi:hypothetical protein